MTRGIHIFDNALPNPEAYRAEVLRREFRTFDFSGSIFHGIAANDNSDMPAQFIPGLEGKVTFFRRSPYGQREPNFIHTDIDMGDWTGILYLNPDAPPEDGTLFWEHLPTGRRRATPEDRMETRWMESEDWDAYQRVEAKFNRLLIFDSTLFHSRALFHNYGTGDEARLIQVFFGKGKI